MYRELYIPNWEETGEIIVEIRSIRPGFISLGEMGWLPALVSEIEFKKYTIHHVHMSNAFKGI